MAHAAWQNKPRLPEVCSRRLLALGQQSKDWSSFAGLGVASLDRLGMASLGMAKQRCSPDSLAEALAAGIQPLTGSSQLAFCGMVVFRQQNNFKNNKTAVPWGQVVQLKSPTCWHLGGASIDKGDPW
eukprot:TRINITY_DN37579_c0_g1_i1.p1 TRINITY_DN37579_c0_g1~~TRINITY_DN37579_c0_g1_i1.p1  ORF type:complete len:144 (+),score=26.15 TRINITY_DN37579_c0_g1_i1:54-434(+)